MPLWTAMASLAIFGPGSDRYCHMFWPILYLKASRPSHQKPWRFGSMPDVQSPQLSLLQIHANSDFLRYLFFPTSSWSMIRQLPFPRVLCLSFQGESLPSIWSCTWMVTSVAQNTDVRDQIKDFVFSTYMNVFWEHEYLSSKMHWMQNYTAKSAEGGVSNNSLFSPVILYEFLQRISC